MGTESTGIEGRDQHPWLPCVASLAWQRDTVLGTHNVFRVPPVLLPKDWQMCGQKGELGAPQPRLLDGHAALLGGDPAPYQQRGAPMPGVCQAAVSLHPTQATSLWPVLPKKRLELLGADMVPGP